MTNLDKKFEQEAEKVILKYVTHHVHCENIGTPLSSEHHCARLGTTFTSDPRIKRKNIAGQIVDYTKSAKVVLEIMEGKLKSAFQKAARSNFLSAEREYFLRLAAEIEQDVIKLSPAFKIVAGGKNGFGTEKYEFIVQKKYTGIFKREFVSLTEAVKQIGYIPSPLKEELQRLKERLDTVENPKPVVLDKKPFRSPS